MIATVLVLAALVVLVATDSANEALEEHSDPLALPIRSRDWCKRFFRRWSHRVKKRLRRNDSPDSNPNN